MSRTVRVVYGDGSTHHFTHLRTRVRRSFNEQEVASMYVPRTELNDSLKPEEGVAEIYLDEGTSDFFGGVLRDFLRRGSEVEFLVESFERYARDAKPTDARETHTDASDEAVIFDAIDKVPQLTRGTTDVLGTSMTFVFSHFSQAKKMRSVRATTGGELRYNADKTVDYVDSLGADKTDTTLGPAKQNVDASVEVERKSGEDSVTHLRALGSGEGVNQLQVEVTAASYDSSERKEWNVYVNREIEDKDTLKTEANTVLSDLSNPYLDVTMTVVDEDVRLGDEYHLRIPAENVDANLRAAEVEQNISAKGRVDKVTFSSRDITRRMEESKVRKDVERLNAGSSLGMSTLANYDLLGNDFEDTDGPGTLYDASKGKFVGPIDAPDAAVSDTLVVPTGTDKTDQMVIPVGTDQYST